MIHFDFTHHTDTLPLYTVVGCIIYHDYLPPEQPVIPSHLSIVAAD
jgi:hypothetical protein